MPTLLPRRRSEQPEASDEARDPGLRNIVVAATLLLSVLVLICEQNFAPTPGYSLAPNAHELQLSP